MTNNRPLVVISDEALLDEVLRLAAAVGCETERAPDLESARPRWADAPLVLLDDTAARRAPDLQHRPGVLLVCKSTPEPETWQLAFGLGVQRVVALPDAESTLLSALADALEGTRARHGPVLAVIGARGGAGASVFAAAVGIAAARTGRDALLVDCDQLGGGLDLLLGMEQEGGLRWPGLRTGSGRLPTSGLRAALPGRDHGDGRLAVVSCAREGEGPTADAVTAIVDTGRRAGDVVVCDLPRHVGAVGRAVLRKSDLVAVVVPAEVRASLSAAGVLGRIGGPATRSGVVVRGPAGETLPPDQVADTVGIPLLTSMASERGLQRAIDRGEFLPRAKGPLAVAASMVLTELSAETAGAGAAR
ncbi:helicase [Amycolatopsis antarctica]|uniref:Helicase n=1 Tax=Amycolatopsis antarctica TaxID=1854586 RepID=A0A263D4L5_9PSEU|nr:septum site-determining protein Ssd [Amycolatopsis antarctica]OZM73400.1 helicase [Amycolatopsis antarctica]